MNLDSIKFKMQLEDLDFNRSKYDKSILEGEHRTLTKYILNSSSKVQMGLSSIEILPANNEVLVQCSAKILDEKYLEGINSNTLEILHNKITPFIGCSFSDVENSTLLRADVTKNLHFDSRSAKEEGIYSLKLGKGNIGFKFDDYTDKRESIIFTGRQKSYKNRQIYYNKEKELNMSRNKEILKLLYANNVKGIGNILRVEQNITSFDKLRSAVGKKTGEVKLGEMVNSKENPILKRHQIIMKYANELDIYSMYDCFEDAEMYEGWNGIYVKCNSNIDAMIDYMKDTTKKKRRVGNAWHYNGHFYEKKKKIQTYFSNNIVGFAPNSAQSNKYFEMLKQVEDLLRTA